MPALVISAGERAGVRFPEFFAYANGKVQKDQSGPGMSI